MENKQNLNDLIEPLKIALNLEKEGKKLFLQAAAETKSSLAKQTFEFLAKEEDVHIAKIEEFYKSVTDSDGSEIPDIEESNADEKLESFNQRLEAIRAEFKPSMTDVEAYKLALDFENGAEDYYQEKHDETDNKAMKKFYRWLIIEETMHARLINSCLKFVEDPAEWFKKRSKN